MFELVPFQINHQIFRLGSRVQLLKKIFQFRRSVKVLSVPQHRVVNIHQRRPLFLSSIISIKMSESDDDTNCPDSVTAQNLVKEFENITNTDEIMGQMYLQVLTINNKKKFICQILDQTTFK